MPNPTVGQVAEYLAELAPPEWAESWDNVGLLVGDPGRAADRILVALELTDGVVAEAVAGQAGLVVVHHPPIFRPLKALRFDTAAGRRLERLVREGISAYAAHTNLDQAQGGTNDTLAAVAGLVDGDVLLRAGEERYVKIVAFVPQGHVEAVRGALAEAGAGHIGNYSHCSFQTPGTGTFLPLEGTHPFLGQRGRLEYAAEVRLETIVPEGRTQQAIRALLAAHPYEEVAYDLYPLVNPGRTRGHGRVGQLASPTTVEALALRLREALALAGLRVVGDPERVVSRVAVGAGSGAMLIPHAARRGADVLITGDIGYHDARDAADAGLALIDIGHFNSEVIVVPQVVGYLADRLSRGGLQAAVVAAEGEQDPFRFL